MVSAEMLASVHGPVPLHVELEPFTDQPLNTESGSAAAVRVTLAPVANVLLQVEPQLRPLGFEDTVPEPVPAGTTCTFTAATKLAVMFFGTEDVGEYWQVPLLPANEHSPPHAENTCPAVGVAVKVMGGPIMNVAEHEPVHPEIAPLLVLTEPLFTG